MKAAIVSGYGQPENVLSLAEREKPKPGPGEILIQMQAATVNRTDWGILTGTPFIIRPLYGLGKPRKEIPGTDFAGVVESVGEGVSGFKVGDKVFGFDDNGVCSHAPYMVIGENKPMLKIPEGVSFITAAASCEGAHYAYNFFTKVNLHPGDKILVNGATGAIGSAMVQLLKHFGAHVTATCEGEDEATVIKLGADSVVDFKTTPLRDLRGEYAYVFDAVGKSTFSECKHLLGPAGTFISSELGPYAQNTFLPLLTKAFGKKRVKFPFPANTLRTFKLMQKLMQEGDWSPLIDRQYPLQEIQQAYQYVGSGRKKGNVVLTF